MSTPVAAPRVFVVEVTDARTGRAHLVTEKSFAVGCQAGRYGAVCGVEVLAASLATPEVGPCQLCRDRWAGR